MMNNPNAEGNEALQQFTNYACYLNLSYIALYASYVISLICHGHLEFLIGAQ